MQAAERRVATVDRLVKNPGIWLAHESEKDLVISSRVRLARNLRGIPFPAWASERDRLRVAELISEALGHISALHHAVFLDMGALDGVDKDVLLERHLVSREMLEKGAGSGVVVSSDERIAIMINEEDHLRLQAITPGMDLSGAWEKINAIDSELEQFLDYAFDANLGYLTACPTNVGTGLRASVMMHLSGLRLMDELEPVIKGLGKLNIAVRGILGEGSEASGNIFQISNQVSLGVSEESLIGRLTEIAEEVATHERNARARLLESRRTFLLDQVGRALGVLRYARILSSYEAVGLLAGLRLGVELGLVRGITVAEINEIMLLTQPGHLQKIMGRRIAAETRDEMRVDLIKKRIEKVSISA